MEIIHALRGSCLLVLPCFCSAALTSSGHSLYTQVGPTEDVITVFMVEYDRVLQPLNGNYL